MREGWGEGLGTQVEGGCIFRPNCARWEVHLAVRSTPAVSLSQDALALTPTFQQKPSLPPLGGQVVILRHLSDAEVFVPMWAALGLPPAPSDLFLVTQGLPLGGCSWPSPQLHPCTLWDETASRAPVDAAPDWSPLTWSGPCTPWWR